MMADTGFLKGLVEFDKDSLSEKQVTFTFEQKTHPWPHQHQTCTCVLLTAVPDCYSVLQCALSEVSVNVVTANGMTMHVFTVLARVRFEVDDAGEEGARVHEGSQVHCRRHPLYLDSRCWAAEVGVCHGQLLQVNNHSKQQTTSRCISSMVCMLLSTCISSPICTLSPVLHPVLPDCTPFGSHQAHASCLDID